MVNCSLSKQKILSYQKDAIGKGRNMDSYCSVGVISVGEGEEVLETDGGSGCTTV